MTESISGWVHSVATVSVIMAVISVITPKNAAGRAAMLCGSIMLTAILVSPIRTFDVSALQELTEDLEVKIDSRAYEIRKEEEKLRESIIEENLCTYILQRTKQFGISCTAETECIDGIPKKARIILEDERDMERVSEILLEECGISRENQRFEVKG